MLQGVEARAAEAGITSACMEVLQVCTSEPAARTYEQLDAIMVSEPVEQARIDVHAHAPPTVRVRRPLLFVPTLVASADLRAVHWSGGQSAAACCPVQGSLTAW